MHIKRHDGGLQITPALRKEPSANKQAYNGFLDRGLFVSQSPNDSQNDASLERLRRSHFGYRRAGERGFSLNL